MAEKLPVVCIFGAKNIELNSPEPHPDFEAKRLDCRCYFSDDGLNKILAKDDPSVIITLGDVSDYKQLNNAPFDVRKRWIHFKDTDNLAKIGQSAFNCYLHNCFQKQENTPPLVSVFTPAYKSGKKINRPYQSLLQQTYKDWEWVIVDDSDDDGETYKMLCGLAEQDSRIVVIKHKHSGSIGDVKRKACMVSRGDFLVELDHDDELTDNALAHVVNGFLEFPDAGFVYTDFAEVFENGAPVMYGENWGYGYGSYRTETYKGREYAVCNAPNINAKTIRHIVAAPNHIRAWRRSFYDSIGGHNPRIHVADDYELMIRTFLNTRMVRVPHNCYIQYRNQEGNTHAERNKEIQRLVRGFSQKYEAKIHQRFLELEVDDFVWREGGNPFWEMGSIPNPEVEPHCTLLAK